MPTPLAFHLPRFDARHSRTMPLASTGLEVPALAGREIEAVWQEIEAAAFAWRARPIAARIDLLAMACAELAARGPGTWRQMLARSTGLSEAGLAAAWAATFAPHDAASLRAAVEAELVPERSVQKLGRVVHVLAGNGLAPTFGMLLRGLLVGVPQWLRPASREPLFAACIAAYLRDFAPELAHCFAVLWWPHASPVEAAVLATSRIVTVQGDDAAVAAVTERVRQSAPQARCIGYGARWSLALLSRDAQTRSSAAALAEDVALFDQQGCLSPQLVLAEDGAGLEAWCADLALELAAVEARLPHGAVSEIGQASLRSWRERQRLGRALGEVRGWWESDRSLDWAVSLNESARWENPPLERHVGVFPFDSVSDVLEMLGERRSRLQGVAADLRGWIPERRARLLTALGATRVAPPGELQLAPAGWWQDHHPPLASLIAPD